MKHRHVIFVPGQPTAQRQHGVVMWVALVVLIVMTLAGVVMLRQMGAGVSIAGNVAFKQNATSVADLGTEAARTWLVAVGRDLTTSQTAAGYLSNWSANVDPAGFDWTAGSVQVTANDGTGNEVRYVVHRLCELANRSVFDAAQQCVATLKRNPCSGIPCIAQPPTPSPFYRVTTRVVGPRNTVSYIQVVLG